MAGRVEHEHTWLAKVLSLLQGLPVHLNIKWQSPFVAFILNP